MIRIQPISSLAWRQPLRPAPVLDEGAVHVWYCAADSASEHFDALDAYLSEPQRDRIARLRPAHHRHAQVAHGLLAWLLGSYLGKQPRDLVFTTGAFGKPGLLTDQDQDVSFSLSHAEGMILIAISKGRPIGVDVEKLRPVSTQDALSEVIWTTEELTELAALPREKLSENFLFGWARKEASLKALGLGLSQGCRAVTVSWKRTDLARVESPAGHAERRQPPLRLHTLELHPEYVSALAVGSIDQQIAGFKPSEAGLVVS